MHKLVKVLPSIYDFVPTIKPVAGNNNCTGIHLLSPSRDVICCICDYLSMVIHAQAELVRHIARAKD